MEFENIKQTVSMNTGNDYGGKMLTNAIKMVGVARGIVIDKDNVILCGDKVFKSCIKNGIKKIHVVETQGDTLVVVKRTDVTTNSVKGCLISLLDNLTGKENLEWNTDYILEQSNNHFGFNPVEWGGDECITKEIKIEELLKEDVQKTDNNKKKVFNAVQQKSLFE